MIDGTIEYNKNAVDYLTQNIIELSFFGKTPVGDADNAEYGTFITVPDTDNTPTQAYGCLWTYGFNSGAWKIQFWNSTTDNYFYTRKNINFTSWTEWIRIN